MVRNSDASKIQFFNLLIDLIDSTDSTVSNSQKESQDLSIHQKIFPLLDKVYHFWPLTYLKLSVLQDSADKLEFKFPLNINQESLKDTNLNLVRGSFEDIEIELFLNVPNSALEISSEQIDLVCKVFHLFLKKSWRESENYFDIRFRSILDNLQEGVTIGDLDDRFLYVNRKFIQMVEYSQEELLGQTAYKFLVPIEEQKKIIDGTQRRQSGLIDSYECTQITKTGNRIKTLIHAMPYKNYKGEVIGNIAIIRDITQEYLTSQENARLQKQWFRAQKMEAVGQLAAGFAHDFNNNLTAILGHLNFIKLQPNLDKKIVESLEGALKSCNSATNLAQKLLTFSHEDLVKTDRYDLRALVDESLSITNSLIPNNISVRISAQTQKFEVEVDKSLVVQAITNLIINAVQAMKDGGTLSFSMSSTDVLQVKHLNRLASSGRFITLNINDTGDGIPEHLHSRIFEPFYTTKKNQGSGLGLSMVYSCMQKHKGWIEVDSMVGQGTSFSMYFPTSFRTIKEIEVISSDEQKKNNCSQEVILVIDDEEVLGELACSFLQRAGLNSINFSDPLKAFAWYEKNFKSVSLILLDMKMPEFSGTQAFHKLKEINPNARVVLISGYLEDENVSKLLNQGAISFIQKPVKYSELVDWIKKTLQVSANDQLIEPLTH